MNTGAALLAAILGLLIGMVVWSPEDSAQTASSDATLHSCCSDGAMTLVTIGVKQPHQDIEDNAHNQTSCSSENCVGCTCPVCPSHTIAAHVSTCVRVLCGGPISDAAHIAMLGSPSIYPDTSAQPPRA